MRYPVLVLGALASLLLAACGALEDRADPTPNYRYRLTVEVDTPEGLKTGSSVIEVRLGNFYSTANGLERIVYPRAYGEAVAVDLPGGQTLYALLRSAGGDVDWATRVVPFLIPDQDDDNPWDDALLMEGKQALPRMWPRVGHIAERPAFPMMVTFGDEADPTSVEQVDPDDLATTFGEGVELKRITVELTDDPVTTGIEERLGWLPDYYDKMLDGRRINTVEAENRLANDLSQGAFSNGMLQ